MLRIGAGFEKTSQSGGTYISIAIEKEILKFHPELNNFFINLIYNKDQKSDGSPQWTLVMAVKEPPKQKDDGGGKTPADEEIPF